MPAGLRHQRRLPDASLATHDDSTAALTRTVDKVVQNAQLAVSPVQPHAIAASV
jgi:hypothetical protein